MLHVKQLVIPTNGKHIATTTRNGGTPKTTREEEKENSLDRVNN
jgi:hypothetical protein